MTEEQAGETVTVRESTKMELMEQCERTMINMAKEGIVLGPRFHDMQD